MQPRFIYYGMRGMFSVFYQMWLTVTLLYHTTTPPNKACLLIAR